MRRLPIALFALTSCHPQRAIELPPMESNGSLLLAVTRDAKLDLVWATELAMPKYPDLAARGALELTAIEMCCPLETLGLRPGMQALRAEPYERPLLPAPKQVHVSTLEGGSQSVWADANGISTIASEVLRTLQLPDDHLCQLYSVPFETRDASFHGTVTSSTPNFGLRLNDGTVFVGTLTGDFLIVSEDQAPSLLTGVSTTTPHHAGFHRSDGEIYLLGKDGETAHGTITERFSALAAKGIGGATEHVRLDGAKDGAIDIFAVSDARALEHFDGIRWTTLSTATPETNENNLRSLRRPSVAWIGPREALVARMNQDQRDERVLHYRGGEIVGREEPFGGDGEDTSELFNFPDWGVVAASDRGRINFRDEAGAWGEAKRVFDRQQIRSVVSLGSNLLVWAYSFVGSGLFAQYSPHAGSCVTRDPYTSGFVRHMIPLGERSILILLVNTTISSRAVQMTVLEKKGDVPPCLLEN